MNATPRFRSGYPETPRTVQRSHSQRTPDTAKLPLAPENIAADPGPSQPWIPLHLIDAPTQRFWVFAIYGVLQAFKLWDWKTVADEGVGSWGMFLKWIILDFAYVFLVPELRIPWLDISQIATIYIYLLHLLFNWFAMFLIPIPVISGLLGIVRSLYDSEISVSEHNVKVANILSNQSHIRGKVTLNILPEGSAVMNPDHAPMCLSSKSSVAIPIVFNATIPAEIEIIRIDLDTAQDEIIKIPNREVNKLAKLVRNQNADPSSDGFRWDYSPKKPGIYRLGKVLDQHKLQVQRQTLDTYVVPCPQARIIGGKSDERCIQDLSDLTLEVTGTPPLKIHYSRTINGQNQAFHFQSLQPEAYSSAMVVGSESDNERDVSWVRPSTVPVRLNESMASVGEWEYVIDEVHDKFGNAVYYGKPGEDAKSTWLQPLAQRFTVKERPKVSMQGCDLRNPLKVAKGHSATLPVALSLPAKNGVSDTSHEVTWAFSPIDSLTNSGSHGDLVTIGSFTGKNSKERPRVNQPGLYTLKSVTSGMCEGQVEEPSSCLILNPVEPSLTLRTEEIADKCASNSIGLRVDLDFLGTPPFLVRYEYTYTDKDGVTHPTEAQAHRSDGVRSQLSLIPKVAGHYTYTFKSIDDGVYVRKPLSGPEMTIEQVVKPAASARFLGTKSRQVCLDAQVETEVEFIGDPPFTLEWEIEHEGKRKTHRLNDIQQRRFAIQTPPLTKGGEYNIALISTQDVRGCRSFLTEQIKVLVRRQQPRAAFGLVDAKRSRMEVEGTRVRLPLRLQGEGPWTVQYRNLNSSSEPVRDRIESANGALLVQQSGTWEIQEVFDNQCPGIVDPAASRFDIQWYPRPQLSLVGSDSLNYKAGNTWTKADICEGDIDGFELNLQGSSPFNVDYEIRHKPISGSSSMSRKNFDAALSKAAISMDTGKAGDYTYKFHSLADKNYNDKSPNPLIVEQHINARPTATFAKPGQTFKLCAEEQEHEETIPIKLAGHPPFFVEMEVKHQAGAAPDIFALPAISTKTHGITIPRQHLRQGSQQIRIRRVRDGHGCSQKYENNSPSVVVHLYDAPSIYPLDTREDYCVGERIAYTLSGTPPFDISYEFNGKWNAKSQTTSFRRVAEKPGDFVITGVSDKASECRAAVHIPKTIHPLPSVQISHGRMSHVDIHEGGEVDIHFDFWGTPPFEFTFTRSSNPKKGQRSVVLETRHDVSYEHKKVIKASQEGTYEVVAIKDKYCSFSTQQLVKKDGR
ncbi:uncharacterized protein F5Z01DRAFT_667195 [Emericellopsis atlantica]|uniref:Nucleoporin Pom152 n=1 Tax=Emericellopsis atlantica TaxID=2614577 RepID=A0A9P7ZDP6_9HYPO|nr:uncharacterized protein F5Z01DRAFT_667195 [Emericellopsis atlantica]KAG9250179.1 hypothetical protein F5Z01DRAFT_667195 [Emericellopsis atlantica]